MNAGHARHARSGSGHTPPWNLPAPRPRRWQRGLLLAVIVVVGSAGGFAVTTTGRSVAPPVTAIIGSAAPMSETFAAGPTPTGPTPTGLRIAALHLDTRLIPIDVDPAGVLQPPATTDVVGWFVHGAAPGQPGPAVLAGHIDSRAGPGVFFHLHELTVGAVVDITESDGSAVHYRVVGVRMMAKDEFPTSDVYGPTPEPELRLITCGGQFDRVDRRYLQNVIVSAVLVT